MLILHPALLASVSVTSSPGPGKQGAGCPWMLSLGSAEGPCFEGWQPGILPGSVGLKAGAVCILRTFMKGVRLEKLVQGTVSSRAERD